MGPSSCTFRKKWFLQNKWNHSSTEMKKSQLRPHRKSCSRNHHTCAPLPPPNPLQLNPDALEPGLSAIWITGPRGCSPHTATFACLHDSWWRIRTVEMSFLASTLPRYPFPFSMPLHFQRPQGNSTLKETERGKQIFQKCLPCQNWLAQSQGVVGRYEKGDPPPPESALCQSRICKLAQVSHASTERYQGDYTGMCRAQERQNLSGPERFTSSEDWLNPSFWNKKVTGSTQSPRGLYSTISLKVPWCEIQSETCFILTYVMIWCCFERDYSKEIITSMSMYNICEPYDYSTCQSCVQEMQIHITGFFFFDSWVFLFSNPNQVTLFQ